MSLGLISACAEERPYGDAELDEEIVEDAADPELYGDLFTDPGVFLGDDVTVSGEVLEVIDPRAFRIAGPRAGDSLLVVSAPPHGVKEDEVVKVTGQLDELELLRIEEELDTDLDDDVFDPYEGDYVVVAKAVDH